MTNTTQEPMPLILAIDDDETIHLILDEILGREDFEVLSASNGKAGLEMFRQRRPDLLLLDVMMPQMDGFACLEALRAMPGTQLVPIVMLTGADDVDSIHRCFELGATDFIAKPINWPILPYRLRYLIRANQALANLARSESVLRNAQKIAHLGNWDWEINTDRITCSNQVFKVLGLTPWEFHGHRQDLFKTVHPAEIFRLHQALELSKKHGHAFSLEIRAIHDDQTVHVVQIQGETELQEGLGLMVHGTVQDITERRKIEEKVRFLSYYDPLTGLPNRNLFKEILGKAINHCDNHQTMLAGLFIGIDRFKRINETLGPSVGDRILQLFADRLMQVMHNSDHLAEGKEADNSEATVSRLGGNEFTIMLMYIRDMHDSVKVINHILKALETPFNVEGHEIYLAIYIGIAVYPGDGPNVDNFIKNGEFAMNHAHKQGQNVYQFFSKSLNVAAFHRLSMENDLRRAIERDELILHYQPKIDLKRNEVVGMEALVRWQHPDLGLVSPAQFIPIAEDSGLIVPISEWVITTACRQLRAWQREKLPPLIVAVNVSAVQFRHKGFLQSLRTTLETIGLAPEGLKLELTESILLDDFSEAFITLCELRSMGIQISIDDFGTGYSSLAYLKKLPISELKIDRSFIRDIPNSVDDMTIVSAIICLAKTLSLDVVAEGVETEQQLSFLDQHGCDMVQGYFFSKPLVPEEFVRFVRDFERGNKKCDY